MTDIGSYDLHELERAFREANKRIGESLRVIFGTPISRSDALAKSRAILSNAEHERLRLADEEAARGIQYEDDTEDGGLFV